MPETIDLSLKLSIEQLKQQLAQLGPTGDKEAARMVNALTKQYAKAEAAAKKAAKTTEKEWEKSVDKIDGISEKLANKLGGPFAQVSDLWQDVLKPIGEATEGLGAAGAAAATAGGAFVVGTAAVGGLALGMTALASAAKDAHDRLAEQGVAMGPNARADLAVYAKGQNELSIALDKIKVTLGGGLARDLGKLDDELARGVGIIDRYALRSEDANDNISLGEDLLNRLYHRLGYADTSIDKLSASTKDATEQGFRFNDMIADQIATQPKATAELMDQVKGMQHAESVTRDGALAKAELAKETREWALADMEATAAGVVAADKQKQAFHDQEQVQAAMFRAAKRGWDDYTHNVELDNQELAQAVKDSLKAQAEAFKQYQIDRTKAQLQYASQITESIGSIAQSDADAIQRRIDGGDKLTRAQIDQANAALEIAKDAALLQAGVTSTMIGLETWAQLSPFLTPFGAALAGSIAAASSYAAAAYGIATSQPAKFSYADTHQGLLNDNGPTMAERGETSGFDPTTGEGNTGKPPIDPGVTDRTRGGSEARVRHGGVTFHIRVTGSRTGKLGKRGGRV